MSPRTRVLVIVGLAAATAVAAVVGVTLLQTRGESTTPVGAVTSPRPGTPPLELDFGVRSDAEAGALARAQTAYNKGHVAEAAAVFGRYHSLQAQIGSAFAAWRDGHGLDSLKSIVAAHPRSALAELHLGWAYYWSGRNADAVVAWQRASQLQPDSPYAVDALDALHPSDIPGLPPIVTTLTLPGSDSSLSAARQLARLRTAAGSPGAGARQKILYGLALWNLRRPSSAERQFAAAARLAPGDPVARTAAAVGAYSKADPVRAFARLGPLTGRFPASPVVRFHLGLLLLWDGQRKKAAAQLRDAIADGPQTVYAKNAKVLLVSLAKNGTR